MSIHEHPWFLFSFPSPGSFFIPISSDCQGSRWGFRVNAQNSVCLNAQSSEWSINKAVNSLRGMIDQVNDRSSERSIKKAINSLRRGSTWSSELSIKKAINWLRRGSDQLNDRSKKRSTDWVKWTIKPSRWVQVIRTEQWISTERSIKKTIDQKNDRSKKRSFKKTIVQKNDRSSERSIKCKWTIVDRSIKKAINSMRRVPSILISVLKYENSGNLIICVSGDQGHSLFVHHGHAYLHRAFNAFFVRSGNSPLNVLCAQCWSNFPKGKVHSLCDERTNDSFKALTSLRAKSRSVCRLVLDSRITADWLERGQIVMWHLATEQGAD